MDNKALLDALQKFLPLVQRLARLMLEKQQEVDRLKRERDRLAIEVQRLKAELIMYAGGDVEN